MIEKSFDRVLHTSAAIRANAECLQNLFWILSIPGTNRFLDLFFGDAFADTNVHVG